MRALLLCTMIDACDIARAAMETVTATEARKRFGAFLRRIQREPLIVTKTQLQWPLSAELYEKLKTDASNDANSR